MVDEKKLPLVDDLTFLYLVVLALALVLLAIVKRHEKIEKAQESFQGLLKDLAKTVYSVPTASEEG